MQPVGRQTGRKATASESVSQSDNAPVNWLSNYHSGKMKLVLQVFNSTDRAGLIDDSFNLIGKVIPCSINSTKNSLQPAANVLIGC